MRIIAIDPGTAESAWCVLDEGVPSAIGKEENRLIVDKMRQGFAPFDHGLLAVEMVASYGMPVGKEVFETVLWIGRFVEAWDNGVGAYRLIYRKDVKLFHCHSLRANDSNIRACFARRTYLKKRA